MPLAFSQWHLYRLDFMVRPAGLEPATFWFVAKHSIRLSYERIYTFVISSPAQKCGGEQGIRTHGTLSSPTVFKTVTLNRSDTPP